MTARRTSSGLGRTGLFAGCLVTLAAALMVAALALPGGANADQPFRIDFDDSELKIGPVADLPFQEISSGASIEGTVDPQGRVSIPKEKFTLPVLGIDEPVKVRSYIGIEDDATGTWDPETGEVEIRAKAGLWLSINIPETLQALQSAGITIPNLGPLQFVVSSIPDLTCGFSPMDLTFTTDSTPRINAGLRFTRGLNGPGALTADWTRLGPFAGKTKLLFLDVCTTLRSLAPTLIANLAGNAIPGVNIGNLDIAGLLANLDNLDLGPSSLTISRTVDQSIPASLSLSRGPGVLRAKAGRTVKLPVRVTNPGERSATNVNICPRMSKSSRISGRCIRVGVIPPGKTVTRDLLMKPARSTARKGRTRGRTEKVSVIVSGEGLPSQTRGVTLRISG